MKEYRRVRHAANTAVLTVRGCSDLLGDAAADGPGGLDAGGARLGQAAGDAARHRRQRSPGMEVSSSPDSSRREE